MLLVLLKTCPFGVAVGVGVGVGVPEGVGEGVGVGVGVGVGPIPGRPRTISSMGRVEVCEPPAFMAEMRVAIAPMSVRVSALTVILWFGTKVAAAAAAAVFATNRHRTVAPGTRFGLNMK